MKEVFVIFLLSLSGLLHAQNCELLTLDAVWLDPFDNQKMNLICTNESWDEIYSYPSWLIRDLEGNIIAQEEVMYFGIAGSSYHFLNLVNPWPDNSESVSVIMELWTGFGDSLACSMEWELVPRELEWTGTGDLGCFPVRFSTYSNDANGCSLNLDLENGSGESVWSEILEMNASTNFSAQSDSFCLSQSECYALHAISSPTSQITMQMVDPSEFALWNLQHWSYFTNSNEISILDTTFVMDLYGEDCDMLQASGYSHSSKERVYPNPVVKGQVYHIPCDADAEITLWDARGRMTSLDSKRDFRAPNESGTYFILVKSVQGSRVYPLIVR
jgi:hypothetical protein